MTDSCTVVPSASAAASDSCSANQVLAWATISARGRQASAVKFSTSAKSCSGVTRSSFSQRLCPSGALPPRHGVGERKVLAAGGVDGAAKAAGLEQPMLFEQVADRGVGHPGQPRGSGEKRRSGHLGLDRTQPAEQLQHRVRIPPVDGRELPAQGVQAQILLGQPAHSDKLSVGTDNSARREGG